ncbi:aa3-type cytochrome c oxidase subunit IV [Roseovarius sp. D22-M7]|uniref:aa3-type cytochrome c oxidase subunit IV n=1 Tax=Roseovarius sp. D22-M7 TaxID=3127116 RepID=UPI003010261D
MADDDEGQKNMKDETPGKMNIETQEKTFEGFVKAVTWSVVTIIVILVVIAMIGA